MHDDRASRTSSMHDSLMCTPVLPRYTSACAMCLTTHILRHSAHSMITHVACWHDPLFLHLLCIKENSAASDKCHFRVRHFGRVFNLPYTTAVGLGTVRWNCWRLAAASASFAWALVWACHALSGWNQSKTAAWTAAGRQQLRIAAFDA